MPPLQEQIADICIQIRFTVLCQGFWACFVGTSYVCLFWGGFLAEAILVSGPHTSDQQ